MSEKAQNPDPEAVAVGNVVDGSPDGSPHGSLNSAPAGAAANQASAPGAAKQPPSVSDMGDQPAKVLRIGTMVKQLLDEVKSAPLDDAARARLAEIHQASITELEEGLAPELVAELHRLSLPFTDNASPSDAELRIAHAQLVGWLEGLFHGIQTAQAAQAMASQQTAARLALRQLPPGTMIAPGVIVGENGEPQRASAGQGGPLGHSQLGGPDSGGPGQYL
ncbi:bacterial proteasome activator family protein [Arthrobacter sp. H35-D1]|uniref:bacterial proteasome activator family protein n=1 Tax=Arthrobacter sp. H35-D1 TaxID=3046202 RepID=UPI0024BB22E0|nr:bacterial proteasome activator family protein [Arthrobacter sp. H35-D1]MDJ0315048.1 bacterial proteasome activator family protein [Arthrobacter sp. H35-D1]